MPKKGLALRIIIKELQKEKIDFLIRIFLFLEAKELEFQSFNSNKHSKAPLYFKRNLKLDSSEGSCQT